MCNFHTHITDLINNVKDIPLDECVVPMDRYGMTVIFTRIMDWHGLQRIITTRAFLVPCQKGEKAHYIISGKRYVALLCKRRIIESETGVVKGSL